MRSLTALIIAAVILSLAVPVKISVSSTSDDYIFIEATIKEQQYLEPNTTVTVTAHIWVRLPKTIPYRPNITRYTPPSFPCHEEDGEYPLDIKFGVSDVEPSWLPLYITRIDLIEPGTNQTVLSIGHVGWYGTLYAGETAEQPARPYHLNIEKLLGGKNSTTINIAIGRVLFCTDVTNCTTLIPINRTVSQVTIVNIESGEETEETTITKTVTETVTKTVKSEENTKTITQTITETVTETKTKTVTETKTITENTAGEQIDTTTIFTIATMAIAATALAIALKKR